MNGFLKFITPNFLLNKRTRDFDKENEEENLRKHIKSKCMAISQNIDSSILRTKSSYSYKHYKRSIQLSEYESSVIESISLSHRSDSKRIRGGYNRLKNNVSIINKSLIEEEFFPREENLKTQAVQNMNSYEKVNTSNLDHKEIYVSSSKDFNGFKGIHMEKIEDIGHEEAKVEDSKSVSSSKSNKSNNSSSSEVSVFEGNIMSKFLLKHKQHIDCHHLNYLFSYKNLEILYFFILSELEEENENGRTDSNNKEYSELAEILSSKYENINIPIEDEQLKLSLIKLLPGRWLNDLVSF